MSNRVLIWRSEILPGSETFVRDHADAFPTSRLVGAYRTESPLVREEDHVLYGRSLRDRAALWVAARTGIAPRIHRYLRDTRPDLIHAHFLVDSLLIARAARRLNIPLVVTCHGYDVTALTSSRRYRWRTRRVLRHAAGVIACSHFISRQVRALAPWVSPQVIYNGVPAPGPLTDTPRDIDILFVGRLVNKKGVAHVISALADAPVSIHIVGDGPLRPVLETQAASAQADITFHGFATREDTAALWRRAKLFVGPSHTADDGDAEGLGQVFLEAQRQGVPVVAYRHGGVPEAVLDGHTGVLVEEGDIDELRRAVREVLASPERRQAFAAAGRDHVRENFSAAECYRQLGELYERL